MSERELVQPSLRRMRAFGIRPKRELGQNFLIDSNILDVIARAAALDAADVVLEVGGGLGVLSEHLAERVAERGLERAVELDDVHVGAPLGQVLGEDAEPAADLQAHVVRSELGQPRDDVEDVRVDEEVLAEVALRPHAELAQAPQARLGRQVPGHHPNSLAALASTRRSRSS